MAQTKIQVRYGAIEYLKAPTDLERLRARRAITSWNGSPEV